MSAADLIEFSHAASLNIQETGIDDSEIQQDVRNVATGDMSGYRLLARCLDGADADRVQGWRDYVSAIVAAAEVQS